MKTYLCAAAVEAVELGKAALTPPPMQRPLEKRVCEGGDGCHLKVERQS